jgi:hypothetical protein
LPQSNSPDSFAHFASDTRPSPDSYLRTSYLPGMGPATRTLRISDLPLWRLIVLLDDLERTVGPHSATARAVARIIRERMAYETANEGPEAASA